MQWFNDLKIRTKLIGAFVVLSAITGYVGYEGIVKMSEINSLADEMYLKEVLGVSHIKEANVALVNMQRAERGLLLSSTAQEREEFRKRAEQRLGTLKEHLDLARPMFYTERGIAELARLDRTLEEYIEVHRRVVALAMQDDLQRSRESVALALSAGREKADLADVLMTELGGMKDASAKAKSAETTALYQSARTLMLFLVIASVLLGLGMGYGIARAIGTPIRRMVDVAAALYVK
jgi:methyl-accepting chemotaxis protein